MEGIATAKPSGVVRSAPFIPTVGTALVSVDIPGNWSDATSGDAQPNTTADRAALYLIDPCHYSGMCIPGSTVEIDADYGTDRAAGCIIPDSSSRCSSV